MEPGPKRAMIAKILFVIRLKMLFFLIAIRHKPKPGDRQMMQNRISLNTIECQSSPYLFSTIPFEESSKHALLALVSIAVKEMVRILIALLVNMASKDVVDGFVLGGLALSYTYEKRQD